MAAAIVVDAGAFFLWNLGSRSPSRLARDIAGGATRPAVAVRGLARFAGGVLLLLAGALLLLPIMLQLRTFTVLETWTLLTGLLVEQLLDAGGRVR